MFPVDDAVADRNSTPVIPAEQFAAYMAELDAAGFQVIVHAIGDGTVRATLDGNNWGQRNKWGQSKNPNE